MTIEIRFKDFECLICGYINELPKHVDENFEQARQHALTMHGDLLRFMGLPQRIQNLLLYVSMVACANWPITLGARVWFRVRHPEGPL